MTLGGRKLAARKQPTIGRPDVLPNFRRDQFGGLLRWRRMPQRKQIRATSPSELCEGVLNSPSPYMMRLLEPQIAKRHPNLDAADAVRAVAGDPDAMTRNPESLQLAAFLVEPYANRHGSGRDYVVFWPEDFVSFFVDLAEAAGIDQHAYGRKLDSRAKHPDHVVGVAFTILAEVEEIYVETPGALTEFRVPKSFLVAIAAAMIGIATGKAAAFDPTLGGAVSGVGALLISILANRYGENIDTSVDWLEAFVLQVAEQNQPVSLADLRELTHVDRGLLEKTMKRLLRKKLVRTTTSWVGGRKTRYEIAS